MKLLSLTILNIIFVLMLALIPCIKTQSADTGDTSYLPAKDSAIESTSNINLLNANLSEVKRLDVPTYDGRGQCTHPSVRYIPEGWAGYEWWMAFTPYPHGVAAHENPSLVASHDGVHWEVPAGLTNPIDPVPKRGHNADAELVFDGEKMEVYYIEMTRPHLQACNDSLITCHRRIVYPDMSVGEEEPCINFHPISPSVVLKSPGDWMAWYCDATSLQLYCATSKDGLVWTNQRPAPTDRPGLIPWHISALQIDKGYLFLMASYDRSKEDNTRTKLYLGYAPDENSTIRTALILSPGGGWMEREVYRSCMVGSRIYISAADKQGKWHIGCGNISFKERVSASS